MDIEKISQSSFRGASRSWWKKVWDLFPTLNWRQKTILIFRFIFTISIASIVYLTQKAVSTLRSFKILIKKLWIPFSKLGARSAEFLIIAFLKIIFIGAIGIFFYLFQNVFWLLLRMVFHPMTIIWVLAILFTLGLKTTLGESVIINKEPTKSSQVALIPIVIALVLTLLYGVYRGLGLIAEPLGTSPGILFGALSGGAVLLSILYFQRQRVWEKTTAITDNFFTLKDMLLVAFGLFVIDLAVWAFFPIIWENFWSISRVFWVINFGLWAYFVLLLKKGEDGKTPDPIARTISSVLLWILIGGILYTGVSAFWSKSPEKIEASSQPVIASLPSPSYHFTKEDMPAEIPLKVIGSCESTGSPDNEPIHYESDGVTLLKNKKGGPARGEYQMMPNHWEKAKQLTPPLDLDKKDEYEKYAVHLWNNEGGTTHWQASESCWGLKLQQIAEELGNRNPTLPDEIDLAYREAIPGEWSEIYTIPKLPGGAKIHTESLGDNKPYRRIINGNLNKEYSEIENVPAEIVARSYAFTAPEKKTRVRIYYTLK